MDKIPAGGIHTSYRYHGVFGVEWTPKVPADCSALNGMGSKSESYPRLKYFPRS
jgi:hypothetical protein